MAVRFFNLLAFGDCYICGAAASALKVYSGVWADLKISPLCAECEKGEIRIMMTKSDKK